MIHPTYKERQKATWMGKYEDLLVKARPDMAGKVDWYTATHLFNRGLTAERAAEQYISDVVNAE